MIVEWQVKTIVTIMHGTCREGGENEETLLTHFLRFGRSLLTQRRRQDLPVLWRRPLDRMELQSLGPYFFTWFRSTSSSSAFHGPFLIYSSFPFLPCIFLTCMLRNSEESFLWFSKNYFSHYYVVLCPFLSFVRCYSYAWQLLPRSH